MPAYLVSIPDSYPGPLVGGHRHVVVFAADATDARAVAAAASGSEAMANVWKSASDSTAVELVASPDMLAYTLKVTVTGAAAQTVDPIEAEYVAVASDTIDLVGAGIATALNAAADIANAAYNSTTNVLTVAGAGDGLGDGTVTAQMLLNGIPIESFIGTITDEGSAGAALTVALASDAFVIPAYYLAAKV